MNVLFINLTLKASRRRLVTLCYPLVYYQTYPVSKTTFLPQQWAVQKAPLLHSDLDPVSQLGASALHSRNECAPEFQLKCLTCHYTAPEKNPMFDFCGSLKTIRNLLGEFPRKSPAPSGYTAGAHAF